MSDDTLKKSKKNQKVSLKIITVLVALVSVYCIALQVITTVSRTISIALDILWIASELYILAFVYINLYYQDTKETNTFIK
jgi:hypothetical protein